MPATRHTRTRRARPAATAKTHPPAPPPQPPHLEFFDCDLMLGSTLRSGIAGWDADRAVAELDRCGIARALVHGHTLGPDAFVTQNRIATDAAARHPRLFPCMVLPQFPLCRGGRVLPLVQAMARDGARAFLLDRELGPASGALSLTDFPEAAACWRFLAQKRLPVFLPCGHLPARDVNFDYNLADIAALCRRHPALPVVLLYAPYIIERLLRPVLARCPNLHLAITRFGLFGQLESLVADFGAGRFLYGSGAPWNDPAIARGAVAYAALTPAQRQLIAGGNLNRLLRLP